MAELVSGRGRLVFMQVEKGLIQVGGENVVEILANACAMRGR